MIKFSKQFKLRVVQDYLNGKLGFTLIAVKYGVDAALVRRWVAVFGHHGEDGLCGKVQRYDVKFKVSVLRHMWENALSCNQAAAIFNIRSPSSIGEWRRRYRDGGVDAIAPPRTKTHEIQMPTSKPAPKPDRERTRDDLIKEVEYLRMENEVLKKLQALAQARKSSDKKKPS